MSDPSRPFAAAHAAAPTWEQALRGCLDTLPARDPGPALGFVYVTDPFADRLPDLVERLREETGVADWVGTVGIGVCGGDREYHDTPAMSLLIAALPPDSWRLFQPLLRDAAEFSAEHGAWCRARDCHFALVHGDPRNPRLPALLEALSDAMPDGFLCGGLTSSRGRHRQVAGPVGDGGLSGVLLAPQVGVATGLTQSCLPFGETYRITESQSNVLITLNDEPALDVFYREIGDILARDLDRAGRYIAAALPIPGSDTGDYLVRNVVGVDPRHRVLAIGDEVQDGQSLRFCRRDPANALRDMERMLEGLKARLERPPRGAVYYSCLGRGRAMFGDDDQELATIRRSFPDLPLAGFFCSGEISGTRLYGYTGVLVLFT